MAKIKRLLVANRGEIAIRIFATARELDIYTVAVYTAEDSNHAVYADESILLQSASDFTSVTTLVDIAKQTKADAVHPGYGFLSESAEFAEALSNNGITFVGPSLEILRQTGDKTAARALAQSCQVPVLPASLISTADVREAREFANQFGFPLMIKAVDGGGGRGIRLVRSLDELDDNFNRACGESPSGRVFFEKAAIDGFRHVEVQILGDRFGQVTHLWERECSVQRRFQKIVELAPSTIRNRSLVDEVIQSAIRMAKSIQYTMLGTFEFLVHESRPEYYFLEINPRLQVEHTITEEITSVDLVRCQLLLAQGCPIEDLRLPSTETLPSKHAMQLRVTAEDASKGFTLSIGRITSFRAPAGGPGIRVDTHLSTVRSTTVGSSYDSLLAKVIVRSSSYESTRLRAIRALKDTAVSGVTTNIDVLMGILTSEAFQQERCDTRWLESNLDSVISNGKILLESSDLNLREKTISSATTDSDLGSMAGLGAAGVLFRKGDGFKIEVSAPKQANSGNAKKDEYLVRVDRVLTNNFPAQLTADVSFSSASNSTSYAMNITSTTQTSVASSRHRTASRADPTHISLPYPGQFVELLIEEGDQVKEGEVLCVVRQMKMELEIRSPWAGTVKWACEVDVGETVNEGLLICELIPHDVVKSRQKTTSLFKL